MRTCWLNRFTLEFFSNSNAKNGVWVYAAFFKLFLSFSFVVINVNVMLSTCWRRSITLCVRQNKEQHHCMRLQWMTFKQNKWYFILFSYSSAFFIVLTATATTMANEQQTWTPSNSLRLRFVIIAIKRNRMSVGAEIDIALELNTMHTHTPMYILIETPLQSHFNACYAGQNRISNQWDCMHRYFKLIEFSIQLDYWH